MPPSPPHLRELVHRQLGRRQFIGALGVIGFNYQHAPLPLPQSSNEHLLIPKGYKATRLISWGDRLDNGETLTFPVNYAHEQLASFGYNNDFIAFHLLESDSSGRALRGLLSVNHEYTNPSLMTPHAHSDHSPHLSPEEIKVDMAAVGHSVIEVSRVSGEWQVVWGSPYQRRLSALGPIIEISGPAAGHPRLQTSADPTGTQVIGTFSNCAGGQTPWGTTLIAEENINQGFYGRLEGDEAESHRLMDIADQSSRHPWHLVDDRFHINREPHEPNRFGWVVELDPYDPQRAPVKRTALGRFKHECATCTLTKDGRVVIYSGDDQEGEFLYRFVSAKPYHPEDPKAGWGLLDEGTLSVAHFKESGELEWRPLIYGEGVLTSESGFQSQGDILIDTRRAARLVGATPLDRPEDVEISPKTGKVYVMLTQSKSRRQVTPACHRAPNLYGHILELTPLGNDHGARGMEWTPLVLGGPSQEGGTQRGEGWIKNPDNGAFDQEGGFWVTADAKASAKESFGNGLWRCPVDGDKRGQAIRFCTVPSGSEPCGPCFTPDGYTLFLAIQHPGEGSSWSLPTTRWPDFRSDRPPRPTLIAIERDDGNKFNHTY